MFGRHGHNIPAAIAKRRREIADMYIRGDGVEIGALHHPLKLRAKVRYVDRYDEAGLRRHYPELDSYRLAPVHIIDDGETLTTVPDRSLDFVVANHFLEHTENPLGTIRAHLEKIRPAGVLYYAVPIREAGFDIRRPLTTFDHLLRDDQEGPGWSRRSHYLEWAQLVMDAADPGTYAGQLERDRYSIHFHVWDEHTFTQFVHRASAYLGFQTRVLERNDMEMIAVVTRPGT